MSRELWQAEEARPVLQRALGALAARPRTPGRALEILAGIFSSNHSLRVLVMEGIPQSRCKIVLDSGVCRKSLHVSRELSLPALADLLGSHDWRDGQQESLEDVLLEAILDEPSRKLAVYGTLAPGEVNHHMLTGINGGWTEGFVLGTKHETGWGATLGFPAMRWDPSGEPVAVRLLQSSDLPARWERLDEFEGEEYRRILVPVERPNAPITVANIYVIDGRDEV